MMTEKRYTIKPQDDLFGVVDNYSADKVCVINGIRTEIEAKWLCKDMNTLNDENEQLKTENTMLKEHQNINCQNCQYFVSDSVSSDCLKREDIGYKGTCIDGMDLHMLAKNCPYY